MIPGKVAQVRGKGRGFFRGDERASRDPFPQSRVEGIGHGNGGFSAAENVQRVVAEAMARYPDAVS